MIDREKENILSIIKMNHENDMEEEKKKFIKVNIDRVEDTLSRYNCVCICKEHGKNCMHATLGYDFSFCTGYESVMFIFNTFRPNILFDKKDYFAEMEARGYKNLVIDFTNYCIHFDVDYIYSGDTYKLVDRTENKQEKK